MSLRGCLRGFQSWVNQSCEIRFCLLTFNVALGSTEHWRKLGGKELRVARSCLGRSFPETQGRGRPVYEDSSGLSRALSPAGRSLRPLELRRCPCMPRWVSPRAWRGRPLWSTQRMCLCHLGHQANNLQLKRGRSPTPAGVVSARLLIGVFAE